MALGGKGIDCGAKIAKLFLFVFNFIFWLSGLALLGLGIWVLVDKESFAERVGNILEIATAAESVSIETSAIIFIVVGSFIVVVGFCGCCGAIKENRCLLGLYIFFVALIMILEIAAGVLMIVFRKEIIDRLEDVGENYIKEKYTGNSTDIDVAWNYVMQTFECCGMKSPADFKDSTYDRNNTNIASDYCCISTQDGYEVDIAIRNPLECHRGLEDCINNGNCAESEYYYHQGCSDAVQQYIEDRYLIFIIVGIVVGCLEIFGLIFAVCLCTAVGKK